MTSPTSRILTRLNVLLLILVVGLMLCLYGIFSRRPAPDAAGNPQLTEQQKQLQDLGKQLEQTLLNQERKNEEHRRQDSLERVQYQVRTNQRLQQLQEAIKLRDEKIDRIYRFNSDSLRRAYAED